jgi:hypothetical protein
VKSRRTGTLAAIALAYGVSHLLLLAPSLEDIDSINFALGLRHFDPTLHQPHPPGYPVFIALGRLSLAVLGAAAPSLSRVHTEALALAFWSAVSGMVAIVGAARLFAAVDARSGRSGISPGSSNLWGAALLGACPLFWISGARPMSDMTGFAAVLWAQALALDGRNDRRHLTAAVFIAAVAAGIRIQTLALTLPLLALATIEQRTGARKSSFGWLLTRPIAVFVVTIVAWAVPLVILTGGVSAYLGSLADQAGEDFSWVDMLWSNPTLRGLVFALYDTFVLPWGSIALAVVVGICAGIGALVALLQRRAALAMICVAFVPYCVYHLLFQEPITVRYALPLLTLVVWLAIVAFELAGRWRTVVAIPVIGAALLVSVPGGIAYGREAHPAFRALDDAERRARLDPPAASFAHFGLRRPLQAVDATALKFVEPRRNSEWLGLVDYWRGGGVEPVWFFADPKRTDLALVDPRSRRDVVRYEWPVASRLELSGTRPLGVDWYRLNPPGWFAGTGWSLTPEVGGITRVSRSGPDVQPIEAWVRRRTIPMHLVVGGRHLGNAGDPDADVELSIDGQAVDNWRISVAERNFLRFVDLPGGLAGAGTYAHLTIRARPVSNAGRGAEVAIRQFDVQAASELIYGFGAGWHEQEYANDTGLLWRWTSEASVLRVKGPARPVRVSMRGESPLKYFDAAPRVTVTAGGRTIGELRPRNDFEWSVRVPPDAWTASDGAISVNVDRVYLPGPAEGTDDDRHLGVRLYDIRVDTATP